MVLFENQTKSEVFMSDIKIYTAFNKPSFNEKLQFVDFILQNAEKDYDVNSEFVNHAINVSIKDIPSIGGRVFCSYMQDELIAISVVVETAMKGFFPANLIVYFVVRNDLRKQGYYKGQNQICNKYLK
jgi:hypothetical protein